MNTFYNLQAGEIRPIGDVMKWENEIDKKYGKLTVISVFRENSVTWAKCRCNCGCESKRQYKNALADMAEGTRAGGLMRKPGKNNTSGRVGVYFNKNRNKWTAHIKFQGKYYFLGNYDKFEDACKARDIAEKEIHGEFLKWYISRHPDRKEKILKKHNLD